ncbi:MAG: hypothetical protein LBK95_08225 [Bifidobacteriaceae bacterium]|nr:hypothetical protein [Bifidobacteriaceae bacterium]
MAVVLLGAIVAGLGWGYASWKGTGTFAMGPIKHGSLWLGTMSQSWKLKSATDEVLAANEHSQPDLAAGGLAQLTTPCGEGAKLEIVDTYPLNRSGDTLVAEFTLAVNAAPTGTGQVAVADQSGQQLATGVTGTGVTGTATDNTTALVITLTYPVPACDPFDDPSRTYGGHNLKVVQK